MGKKFKMLVAFMLTLCSLSIAAFAETSGTANQAVTSAMQSVSNDMLATGNAVLPIALTVVGLALVVTFGIRLFKGVVRK